LGHFKEKGFSRRQRTWGDKRFGGKKANFWRWFGKVDEKAPPTGKGEQLKVVQSALQGSPERVKAYQLLDRAATGERIGVEEALLLFDLPLPLLGEAAYWRTETLHRSPIRTYHIDRNINYTNICISRCRFCAFWRDKESPEAFVLAWEELCQKIEETIALGGDQILLQGGLHPDLPLSWYEDLLRAIKERFPTINIHAFSPPEIYHFSRLSGFSIEEVLLRLRHAGLGTLPGGGAEILDEGLRQHLSPQKVSAAGWLQVMRTWHKLGGRSTATMMFGHLETRRQRLEHMLLLRQLQEETGGFIAFIPWTFQPGNTALADHVPVGASEYLRTVAVARLFLDNFHNLQASWVTQGLRVAQLALHFGANDMGSLMIEENVVAAAGVRFRTTEEEMRETIREAGFIPKRRNVFYEIIEPEDPTPSNHKSGGSQERRGG
jgi:cyclic dehypoxanthinyl futalosine synthase